MKNGNKLTFSGDLFHTMTECPELSRFLTIPEPIIPRPRNPNLRLDGLMFLSLRDSLMLVRSSEGVSWKLGNPYHFSHYFNIF
jgi:hypothetical protein